MLILDCNDTDKSNILKMNNECMNRVIKYNLKLTDKDYYISVKHSNEEKRDLIEIKEIPDNLDYEEFNKYLDLQMSMSDSKKLAIN